MNPDLEKLFYKYQRDWINDDSLCADLRALQKEITPSGKLRSISEFEERHCDRSRAKALRQHAAHVRTSNARAMVG